MFFLTEAAYHFTRSVPDLDIQLLIGLALCTGVHAQPFAMGLLGKLTEASEEQKASLTPIVRSLDLTFPDQMDAAVNQLLQQSPGAGQATAQGLVGVLQGALAGSAHAPLLPAGTTLASAIDAPSADMRIAVSKSCEASASARWLLVDVVCWL